MLNEGNFKPEAINNVCFPLKHILDPGQAAALTSITPDNRVLNRGQFEVASLS